MKVLAINSSPRGGGQSKTEMMLTPLVEGMRDAGAEVDVVNLREKKIKNCIGCFTCWTKTPGECVHKDDMTNELFPRWLESDLAVYASPLYHYTMNAEMKAFVERTLPILEPFFEKFDNRTVHPLRQDPPAAVVLSVAGFIEMSVFDQFKSYVNFLFGRHMRLWAEIYRPAAETLSNIKDKKEEVLAATFYAGRELVDSKQISTNTLDRIQQPIIDFNTFAKLGNLFWKTCIAEGVTPKEFREKKLVPRPDSLESFMLLLPYGLNSKAAGERKVHLQFNFSGEVLGSCYFLIENGKIGVKEGRTKNPEIIIETPFETWMDIMTGKADGQQMFMEQKYRVEGDLELMIRLFESKTDDN
ncbi:MAG: NAD(P)H-dependent oxidoreductase [Desulfobacterales bacterium]|nr:NAD(P)H-dependent oxidoreductase [Desulfobacterales bacterium]